MFQRYKIPATSPAIAKTIKVIGLASITRFNAPCATVCNLVAISHPFTTSIIAVMLSFIFIALSHNCIAPVIPLITPLTVSNVKNAVPIPITMFLVASPCSLIKLKSPSITGLTVSVIFCAISTML